MISIKGRFGSLVTAIPMLAGCTVSIPYVPNRPPVPLLSHRGELNVSGGVHFPLSTGFDYEVTYAMLDNFSLYGAYQFDRGRGISLGGEHAGDSSNYNNRFFELGVGYFDSVSDWGHYEAYVQCGIGSGLSHQFPSRYSGYTSSSDTTSLTAFRLGIQQNIGIEGSFGAIGFGLGLGFEHLFQLQRTATEYNDDSLFSVSSHVIDAAPKSNFYAEPVIFWRFGWKSIKIMQEIWFTFRTRPGPIFGRANESLTLSLDF